MPINFPDTPAVDQTFTSGDKTWKWTGSVWEIFVVDPAILTDYYTSEEVNALVDTALPELSDSAPLAPVDGTRWFKTTTMQEFMYYNGVWVEV